MNDRFQNFFLPRGSCTLDADTWIQLDEFFELDAASLLKKLADKSIKAIGQSLPSVKTREIIACAVQSDDITQFQKKILTETLQVGW